MLLRSGRQLGIARAQTKYTTYEVAEWMGISQSAFVLWETGKQTPRLNTILKLANIAQYPPARVFSEQDQKFWNVVKDNEFILATSYEKFIYETFKKSSSSENAIKSINIAIFDGLKWLAKINPESAIQTTQNNDEIQITNKYILLFNGIIDYKDFIETLNSQSQKQINLNQEFILKLTFQQKTDFIMLLYDNIEFIFDKTRCKQMPLISFISHDFGSIIIDQEEHKVVGKRPRMSMIGKRFPKRP